jgi:WD40 repeat protein
MIGLVGNPGDTGTDLLVRIVERAREQAPQPLVIACGLGGGGQALTQALRAVSSNNGDGSIVDLVAGAGIGPPPALPTGEAAAGWSIVLTRDASNGSHSLTHISGAALEEQLFCDLLRNSCGVSLQIGSEIATRVGCPTALISDLAAASDDWADAGTHELLLALWKMPTMVSLRKPIAGLGGRALLDLGRALCLMDPIEMELSDEWALLAGALSDRVYSVADIGLALNEFPGLFEVIRDPCHLVRPSSRLARELLLGGVPTSQSEHFAIYRALRDRSVAALERHDDSDRFVGLQLPRQAAAATAIPALTADALGILSSDPLALLRELESEPTELRKPAGKMIALCAHRLLTEPDRASHLELSARKIGLHDFADTLTAQLPVRRWRPLWAQAEMPHTHRVALEHSSPLLSLATAQDPSGLAFAGSADGSVWRISPYDHPSRLAGSDSLGGEIRTIAACVIEGRPFVAVGTSTHAVGVLNGDHGELAWLDTQAHKDPLSVSCIHPKDGGALLTAGVGGYIYRHPLQDGEGQGSILYQHGSEIRDIRVVQASGVDLVVFCGVDGVVGIVRYVDGTRAAHWHMVEDVLNSVSAKIDGEMLLLVAGTSHGSVRQLRIEIGEILSGDCSNWFRDDEWKELTSHSRAVNCVRIIEDEGGLAVLSASSDASWQWNDEGGVRQRALGHVAPIWSIDLMEAERRYVVTAGGEGVCRLWLTDAVLDERIANSQPLAHRGPVSAIELAADPAKEILVITGGNDGDVRAAAPNLPEGGELLARHDSEISTLLSVSINETRSHVVSGSIDGTLRLTSIDAGRHHDSVVLGIAHEGVTSLSLDPLGARSELVSGGMDGTVTSWDLDTRTPIKLNRPGFDGDQIP